jgi:hypothetical protein
MASIIRIKRSQVSGNPSTLAAGELAYSALPDNGANGGDRLYIGIGTETNGNAANHFVVGGKFFTDRLDHTAGVLTASSALVVDGDKKIDELLVDNLSLNGNTLSSTNLNGDITITPNGNGSIILDGQYFPREAGADGTFLKTDNSGNLVWADIPSGSFTAAGDTGSGTFTTEETLTFTGTDPVNINVGNNQVTISVDDATTTTKGIASFDADSFDVVAGEVSIKAGALSNNQLSNSSVTLGTTSVALGETVTEITGLERVDVENVRIAGNAISATNTDGNLVLLGNGAGRVRISNAYNMPVEDGASGQVLTSDGLGNLSFQAPPLDSFSITGNIGSDLFVTGSTLSITGSGALATTITDNSIAIAVNEATNLIKGVASFSSDSFDVIDAAVTIKEGGVSNGQLAWSFVTLGTTDVTLGEAATQIAGLEQVDVDNVRIDGNTVSATDADGNLVLTGNGTGKVSISNAYTLPNADGTAGQLLVTDGSGSVTFQSPASSSFTIAGNTGTDVFNTGETLTVTGSGAISTDVTDDTITISVANATDSVKGVASFNENVFMVNDGAVDLAPGAITKDYLQDYSFTIGTTEIELGDIQTSLSGLTELTVDNINIDGATISATGDADDISVTLQPKGEGSVDVGGKRITSVAEPTQASDAATKSYVDALAEGLHVHASVVAATTASLATLTGGQVIYANGTAGVEATLTLEIGLTAIDGHTLADGERILVKDEVNQAHNGIYVRTSATELTRAADYDSANEVAGGDFVFVTGGTLYNSTGWVQIDPVSAIGTDPIVWEQFSGAGSYLPGDGLSLTGNEFNVNLSTTGGLEFSGANAIQLKNTVAGDGLTLDEGVISAVGTADRITVTSDAIDISENYVGQTSIVTVGTITTGTWSADIIEASKGGTGIGTYAVGDLLYASATDTLSKLSAGSQGQVLQINASGIPVWGDIDGGSY